MRPLAEAIEEWRERQKQQRAFEELVSRAELDRALAENGLADGQLPIVMLAHPRARMLCARMMRQIGIYALPASIDAAHDIERRCIQCKFQRQCEAWLASGPAGTRSPHFCANAATFQLIQERESRR